MTEIWELPEVKDATKDDVWFKVVDEYSFSLGFVLGAFGAMVFFVTGLVIMWVAQHV